MSEERQAATAAALDEASVANGKATMYVLAQYAREEHPTAKVLDLRESDQGDWLTVWTVETDESDEEELDDDGGYASSLYSDVWALRELYCEYDVRGTIEYTPRSGLTSFRMDVAKVLAECGPESPPQSAKVEILHTRDPDSDCGVRVWIDGVEVKAVEFVDIDPGRGYDDDMWEENVESAREADTSPAFKEATLAAYDQMKPTQRKWSL